MSSTTEIGILVDADELADGVGAEDTVVDFAAALILETIEDASSGEIMRVSGARVVGWNGIRVTVTVIASLGAAVDVEGTGNVAVAGA